MKTGMRPIAVAFAAGVAALMAVPVAVAQSAPSSAESRVLQYWARRQAKDLASAWTFYCAEYQARVPQPQFMTMTRLLRFDLRDVKVAKFEPRGDKADVTISYKFSLPTLPGHDLDGQSSDVWSKGADGQWCKDDEPLVLPFPTAGGTASQPAAPGPAPTPDAAPDRVPVPPPGVSRRP